MSDRLVIGGALRVAFFVVLAKAMVASRDLAVAWRFGVGAVADAYNVALTLGMWLPIFIAGAVGAALVPALIRAKSRSGMSPQFIAELNAHALALAGFTALIGGMLAAFAPVVFAIDNPAADAGIAYLLWALAPCAALTTLFYYLANRLQAHGSFVYTLVEGLPALFVVISIVAFARGQGLFALALGMISGGIAQVFVVWWIIRRRDGPVPPPRWTRAAPEWDALLAGIGVMALGQAALSLTLPLDQYFAVRAGQGVPAAFGYANRLLGIVTSLGTLVLGRALLPILAEKSQRAPLEARRLARRWIGISFVLGILGAAIGWVAAEEAIRLAFERGSFTAEATDVVTGLFRTGLWQVPFYLSGVAAVQWLAVMGKFRFITAICFATLALKAVALYLLLPYLGAQALMVSTAMMYAFAWALQVLAVARVRSDEPKSERE